MSNLGVRQEPYFFCELAVLGVHKVARPLLLMVCEGVRGSGANSISLLAYQVNSELLSFSPMRSAQLKI